jgi:hypothetical protein
VPHAIVRAHHLSAQLAWIHLAEVDVAVEAVADAIPLHIPQFRYFGTAETIRDTLSWVWYVLLQLLISLFRRLDTLDDLRLRKLE